MVDKFKYREKVVDELTEKLLEIMSKARDPVNVRFELRGTEYVASRVLTGLDKDNALGREVYTLFEKMCDDKDSSQPS